MTNNKTTKQQNLMFRNVIKIHIESFLHYANRAHSACSISFAFTLAVEKQESWKRFLQIILCHKSISLLTIDIYKHTYKALIEIFSSLGIIKDIFLYIV